MVFILKEDEMSEGTKSEKWEPPSRQKMAEIYAERDSMRAELLHWRQVDFVELNDD